MGILSVAVDPILPVFAIVIIGYLLGWIGRVDSDGARLINWIALTIFVPLLLFDLIISAPFRDFHMPSAIIYFGTAIVVFIVGYHLARTAFRREPGESVLLGLCGVFGNNVFFVLPISMLLYGEENILPIMTIIILETTLFFGSAMVALQILAGGRLKPGKIFLTMARTPMLQAMALGFVVVLTGVSIPQPLRTFIEFNGAAAPPLALFALGVVMSETRLRPDGATGAFVAVKLLGFPLAIWMALGLVAHRDAGFGLLVLGAAAPTGAMAFSLALLQDIPTGTIARVIIWSSLVSLITLAALA